ncbi:2OG-Fe(II) oxygenase family protein [Micromonospora sp. HUAS YX12]|uniref:2OG-Fe(II) oxygenase family protein n=1 Tax=Micromonospora sp. HUAS YX12 TaxID=3156396 RepID=A0AAU7R2X8_9ACTN
MAEAVGAACRTSGFFVVVGHGVSEHTISRMYEVCRAFFAQPAELKDEVRNDPRDPLQRGFGRYPALEMFCATRLGEDAPADTPPDAPGALEGPNRWPALPGFREAYWAYYMAVEGLALELMRLVALALGLPSDWFDDKFDRHMTPLAVNYYLPRDTPPRPGEVRNDPHTDFGTVTVLYQDDAPGGLQVRDEAGNWLDVPPIPGSFVINLGRLMTMWTNDRWTSTVHQVVYPPAAQAHLDRISIAFFHQPNPDAVVSCIPTCTSADDPPHHRPVTSGEFFLVRSRRAYVRRSLQQNPDRLASRSHAAGSSGGSGAGTGAG